MEDSTTRLGLKSLLTYICNGTFIHPYCVQKERITMKFQAFKDLMNSAEVRKEEWLYLLCVSSFHKIIFHWSRLACVNQINDRLWIGDRLVIEAMDSTLLFCRCKLFEKQRNQFSQTHRILQNLPVNIGISRHSYKIYCDTTKNGNIYNLNHKWNSRTNTTHAFRTPPVLYTHYNDSYTWGSYK